MLTRTFERWGWLVLVFLMSVAFTAGFLYLLDRAFPRAQIDFFGP